MRLIPVIDLKDGQVVRGVGGRRDEYRRVETVLTDDPTPGAIARAFTDRFGVQEVYVADLDAIAGKAPNWQAYADIGRSELQLWIDAGVGDVERAAQLAAFHGANVQAIVVGLESLTSIEALSPIVHTLGPARAAFSLDLKEGRPLTDISEWRDASPENIAAAAVAAGVQRMIVLDLAYVGENRGVGTPDLCRRLHDRFPQLELIGGGGVRSVEDTSRLARAGCQAVLIASALHSGRIVPEDVARI